jgi:hypothetical protein
MILQPLRPSLLTLVTAAVPKTPAWLATRRPKVCQVLPFLASQALSPPARSR